MLMAINLDMDGLRTLSAVAETGTQVAAAELVGRTASAVSLQMDRLRIQVGTPLFRRHGRRLVLTEDGERLLGYGRRILALNDEAVSALAPGAVSGPVRCGAVQDLADTVLPDILNRFANRYPSVRLEVRVESSAALRQGVQRGDLDLAVAAVGDDSAPTSALVRLPMVWIGATGSDLPDDEPVPLVLVDAPCPFRKAALAALDRAGQAWRVAVTSPSLSGLRAAVRAGLGVTVRTPLLLGDGLRPLDRRARLPALPNLAYDQITAQAPGPAAERLGEAIAEALSGLSWRE